MNTATLMFDAIPTRVVALDGPFAWLLMGFAGFSIAMLVGSAVASLRERVALRSARAPRRGAELRGPRRVVRSLAGVRRRGGRPSR